MSSILTSHFFLSDEEASGISRYFMWLIEALEYYMCTHTTMYEYMLVAGVIVYFFIHGVLVEKCKVLDVFKRYELWSWFVVKTLFQFLHVCMREGYRDRQREGGWDRGGGGERWCVEERRHRMWDTTESSAALCYLSKILYSTLTTMIFFSGVFLR